MARKKNAAEIKEPDEYRGLVRLAMLMPPAKVKQQASRL